MSNYYLYSVILKDCFYGNEVYKMLIKYPRSKFKNVDETNKEKYKKDMNTFPQIYLKKDNHKDSLLIGGYDKLKELFDLFYKKKYSKNNVDDFIKLNNNFSKKALLRFIELINL